MAATDPEAAIALRPNGPRHGRSLCRIAAFVRVARIPLGAGNPNASINEMTLRPSGSPPRPGNLRARGVPLSEAVGESIQGFYDIVWSVRYRPPRPTWVDNVIVLRSHTCGLGPSFVEDCHRPKQLAIQGFFACIFVLRPLGSLRSMPRVDRPDPRCRRTSYSEKVLPIHTFMLSVFRRLRADL